MKKSGFHQLCCRSAPRDEEIPGGCRREKISEQSVQRAVANSNEAASYYSSQLALRKDHDPVTSLTNELYAIFMCHLLAGSEESLKYTKMLLEDVKKAPKGKVFIFCGCI